MSKTLTIKPSRFSELAQALIVAREPFLVLGSPGIGKSDLVNQATASVGYDFVTDFPPVKEPTDYNGLPFAWSDEQGGRHADFLPLGNLATILNTTTPTVYFLDEIGKATKATQNAVAQVMLSRSVNGRQIPDYVSFVCASNRKQDKAGEQGMPTHFTDRFSTVLTLEPDVEDWCKWALTDGKLPMELIQFIRFRPELLNKFDPDLAKDMVKSPTPRTVASVGRLMLAGLTDLNVIAGSAGEPFAIELLNFLKIYKNLPSVDSILMDPDRADIPTSPDVQFALIGALAAAASTNNIERILKYTDRLPIELSVSCAKSAAYRNPIINTSPGFIKWQIGHGEMLS